MFNSKTYITHMGNTSATLVPILALIMFSTFFMTLQARSLHGHNPLFAHKKVVDIQNFLHKSGIHLSKRVRIPFGDDLPLAPADRLAPGGPDPQHNVRAPPRKP